MTDLAPSDGLHYLGNYVRALPVNLTRMMENAYDWEHLPHIHASSFADIELVDEGSWGWQATVELPPKDSGNKQDIILRVDRPNHYWATTVLSGAGAGTEIHTQATAKGDGIEVDVRFYLPEPPVDEETGKMILLYLQTQYQTLYDEDQGLMVGRQEALDRVKARRNMADQHEIALGPIDDIDASLLNVVETAKGRFAVRKHEGGWIAHPADCPHMLGPLEGAAITADGTITCPWHGYRFNVTSGAGVGNPLCLKGGATVREAGGMLYLSVAE